MQSHGQKRTPEGILIIFLFVANSRFGLDHEESQGCGSAFASVTQPGPCFWRWHYVAYSPTLLTLKIHWARLSTSLAPTNMYMQNSRKFEKNGSSAKRKKRTSARLKTSEHALQTEEASHRPVQTVKLKDKTTLLDLVLNYLQLDMRQLLVKSQPNTLLVSTKCTRLRAMVRCTLGIHTRPTARANKCTNQRPSLTTHSPSADTPP